SLDLTLQRVRSSLTAGRFDPGCGGSLVTDLLPGGLVAVLPAVRKGAQGVDEIAHGGEGPTADRLLGDDAQRDFDELEPRIGLTCGFSLSPGIRTTAVTGPM